MVFSGWNPTYLLTTYVTRTTYVPLHYYMKIGGNKWLVDQKYVRYKYVPYQYTEYQYLLLWGLRMVWPVMRPLMMMRRKIIESFRVADDVLSPLLDSFGWGNHAVLAVPSRSTLEGGSYSDCVETLCTFCLVLTYNNNINDNIYMHYVIALWCNDIQYIHTFVITECVSSNINRRSLCRLRRWTHKIVTFTQMFIICLCS